MNAESHAPPPAEHARMLRLARWLFARPRTLLLVLLVLTAALASQIPRLRFEAGLDVFYDKSSELRQVLDTVNEHFVNDEFIFILYHSDDVFDRATLQVVRELGHHLEELKMGEGDAVPFLVDKVISLATVKDLEGSEQSFQAVALVPDPLDDDTPWDPGRARRRVENNPLLRDGFLSDDGASALMMVRLRSDITDPQRNHLVHEVRQAVAQLEARQPGLTFHVAGGPIFNTDMANYQAQDLLKLVPLGYALMALLVFFFVRRWRGLGIAFLTVSCCFVLGLGVLAAIGSSLNNCSVMLPPVVIALTAAMLLHFLSELAKNAHHHELAQPQVQTLGELLEPAAIAAFTTAVGFMALAVSTVPAVHQFGIAAGITIALCFVVVVILFALVTRRTPAERLIAPAGFAVSPRVDTALGAMADRVVRWRWSLLAGCLLYAVVIGLGISRIVVDNNVLGMFGPAAPVRQATEHLDRQVGGTTTLVVSLRHDDEGHFLEPAALARLDHLTSFMRSELGATRTTSPSDFVKLMHRAFNGDQPQAYRVPDTAAQAAQLLLLNGDTRVEEYLDEAHRWARVEGRVVLHGSTELDRCYRLLERYLAEHFPASAGYQVDATGLARLEADMVNQLISSQVRGFSLSALIIFGVMFLMFRSWRVGLISVWPNLFPITSTLGMMGWAGIRLDVSTVMISSVALGIAVDDTVHFIQWTRERLRAHGDLARAVRETFHVKGPAIIWTSVVITVGFCVSMVSSFGPTRNFGLLIGAAMVTALAGDLILLPAMMLCLKTRLGVTSPPQEKSGHEDV